MARRAGTRFVQACDTLPPPHRLTVHTRIVSLIKKTQPEQDSR
jgi:hypothetical protein